MLPPSQLKLAKSTLEDCITLLEWYGKDESSKGFDTFFAYEGDLLYIRALNNNVRRNNNSPEIPKYLEYWVYLKGKPLLADDYIQGMSKLNAQSSPRHPLYLPNSTLVLHAVYPENLIVFRKGDWIEKLERMVSIPKELEGRITRKAFEAIDDI